MISLHANPFTFFLLQGCSLLVQRKAIDNGQFRCVKGKPLQTLEKGFVDFLGPRPFDCTSSAPI